MAPQSGTSRSTKRTGRPAMPAEEYAALRDKYPGLHLTAPTVVSAELTVEPDDSSWTAGENLTDVIAREVLGPRDGDEEIPTAAPEHVYFVGRISPKKLQRPDKNKTSTSTASPSAPGGISSVSGFSDMPVVAPEAEEDTSNQLPTAVAKLPLPQNFSSFDAEQSTGVPVPGVDTTEPDGEQDAVDDGPRHRGLMIPASMGLRFHIDWATTIQVIVRARWASYRQRQITPTATQADGTDPAENSQQSDSAKQRSSRKQVIKFAYQHIPTEHVITVDVADLTLTEPNDRRLEGDVTVQLDRFDIPGTERSIIKVALFNDYETPQPIQTETWLFQTWLDVDPAPTTIASEGV